MTIIRISTMVLTVLLALVSSWSIAKTTVTIATVNNGDMIRMQRLSRYFEVNHPQIKLKWVVLEENDLRQRMTSDVTSGGGEFDVMTIGMYETPIWGKKGWLTPLEDLPADYDVDDLLPAIRSGLSVNKRLYALPFYGESSMTYYRRDLFRKHGLTMPEQPTWDQIRDFAKVLNDPSEGIHGICLRGKPGWGENMALVGTMANTFGARWFNPKWQPEFTGSAWNNDVTFYVDLLNKYGPPDAVTNGFNENLALFSEGRCGIWVDATVAGSFIADPRRSRVNRKVQYALAPKQVTAKGAGWLWAWALAIPSSSQSKAEARAFITWATSKSYSSLVARTEGIASAPPGFRASTYEHPVYMAAARYGAITIESILRTDPQDATLKPAPYTGVQFVAIPEFQSIGNQVGKFIGEALTGRLSVAKALTAAQNATQQQIEAAGY